ncbi:MAG: hypothetical protein R3A79_14700 [Nannocystaceae bacterium]
MHAAETEGERSAGSSFLGTWAEAAHATLLSREELQPGSTRLWCRADGLTCATSHAAESQKSWALEWAFHQNYATQQRAAETIIKSQYLSFIQSVTEDEINFIAGRDYEMDVKRHTKALRKLIFEQNGIVSEEQHWYPYEVVELCRWHCEDGHEREFAICTVIVCLSIQEGADTTNDIEYMIGVIEKHLSKLDPKTRLFRDLRGSLA